jgi:hypothetical protein
MITLLGVDDLGAPATLQLPNPEFTDSRQISKRRIFRETQSGVLRVYGVESWPTTDIFKYRHSWLTRTQRDAFFTFLENNLGKQVLLTDYLGDFYTGFITEFAEDSVTEARKHWQEDKVIYVPDDCKGPIYTLQFNFEIEREGT